MRKEVFFFLIILEIQNLIGTHVCYQTNGSEQEVKNRPDNNKQKRTNSPQW